MMDSFETKLSKHCYYGNITNILHYQGETISEAELVLLSDTLNCELCFDEYLFLGIQNKPCERGLEKIGYKFNQLDNNYISYKSLLDNKMPILLLINSGVLTHDKIFKGTDKDHHIVLLEDNSQAIKISDSFVPTVPKNIFVGNIDKESILHEIQEERAFGVYLKKQNNKRIDTDFIKNLFLEYIKTNESLENNSIIFNLKLFCDMALKNTEILLTKKSLKSLSYNVKVAGAVARFDYLVELFNNYFNYPIETEILISLKSKWELIANKLMKCSMTLRKDYFTKIFEIEIPELTNKEWCFYKTIITNHIRDIERL